MYGDFVLVLPWIKQLNPFSSFPALDLDYSNGTYGALLDLIDKFFDPDYNIEQQTFEECCRYIFGTEAYILFTIDKLVSALIKQVCTDDYSLIYGYSPIPGFSLLLLLDSNFVS